MQRTFLALYGNKFKRTQQRGLTFFASPVCSSSCDADLPAVDFSDCNPEVVLAEIQRIFVAKRNAADFEDWTSPTEWTERINQSSTTGNDYIRVLTVIADKPAAASVTKDISKRRKKVVGKDHTINFTVDDMSQANYEFMRALECGGEFKIWWETEGGYMYGGNSGVIVNIDANVVNNRGADEIETINGVITWRAKFSPERVLSPIFDSGSDDNAPSTFDNTITFSASATPAAVQGVTATAAATNANQKFEFDTVTPHTGTPATMSIEVSSTEELTVSFPADYLGEWFRYTTKGNVVKTGHFTNGTVSF